MEFDFESGNLALDFANTVEWHASDHPIESLHQYQDLLEWGRQARLLSTPERDALRSLDDSEATGALVRAYQLREVIYRVFRDHAHGDPPAAEDLDSLSERYQAAIAEGRMTRHPGGYHWTWDRADLAADRVLWPVALAAVDLVFSEQLDRVGQCADDRGCGWLFIDTSRNQSRRWCSMESCGNRAKARRYYRRTRGG